MAFVADCQVRHLLGDHDPRNRDWAKMKPKDRIAFMENGPAGPVRRKVWRAIMEALG